MKHLKNLKVIQSWNMHNVKTHLLVLHAKWNIHGQLPGKMSTRWRYPGEYCGFWKWERHYRRWHQVCVIWGEWFVGYWPEWPGFLVEVEVVFMCSVRLKLTLFKCRIFSGSPHRFVVAKLIAEIGGIRGTYLGTWSQLTMDDDIQFSINEEVALKIYNSSRTKLWEAWKQLPRCQQRFFSHLGKSRHLHVECTFNICESIVFRHHPELHALITIYYYDTSDHHQCGWSYWI